MGSMNPYEKLNELHTEFQEEALTVSEKEALFTQAKIYAKQHQKKYYKWPIGIVAAILLSGIIASFTYGNGSVIAGVMNIASDVRVSLAQSFGGSAEGNQYATDVNKTIVLDGKNFTLKNFAFDGDTLFLNTMYEGDIDSHKTPKIELMGVKVNDKFVHLLGSAGGIGPVEGNKNLLLSNMRYSLDKNFPEEGPFKLELIFTSEGGLFPKTTSLTFNTSMKDISKETKAYLLNKGYTDGTVIKHFKFNALNSRFLLQPGEKDTLYELRGIDDKGRKVIFSESRGGHGFAELIFSPHGSEVDGEILFKEVKSLKMTLYKMKIPEHSGRLGNDYQAVGELEFSLK